MIILVEFNENVIAVLLFQLLINTDKLYSAQKDNMSMKHAFAYIQSKRNLNDHLLVPLKRFWKFWGKHRLYCLKNFVWPFYMLLMITPLVPILLKIEHGKMWCQNFWRSYTKRKSKVIQLKKVMPLCYGSPILKRGFRDLSNQNGRDCFRLHN